MPIDFLKSLYSIVEKTLSKLVISSPLLTRLFKKECSIKLVVFLFISTIALISFNVSYFITAFLYKQQIREAATELSAYNARNIKDYMVDMMQRGVSKREIREFINKWRLSDKKISFNVELLTKDTAKDALSYKTGQKAPPENKTTVIEGNRITELYPLKADSLCVRCHVGVNINDTIGTLVLHYDISPVVSKAEQQIALLFFVLLPIPLFLIITSVALVNLKLSIALDNFKTKIDAINSVKDFTTLQVTSEDMGFTELTSIADRLNSLSSRIKSIAVDRDLLEFEIRILEKFIITSEVVRDWKEHVSNLLIEINKVLKAHTLFSIFQVDEEVYDLEIFWYDNPSDSTKSRFEEILKEQVRLRQKIFQWSNIKITHNVVYPHLPEIALDEKEIEFQTKSLILDTPQIGGVVGIGVQAEISKDVIKSLVIDGILTTLINVVGSIKAIYKYTKDLEYYATRDPLTNLYNQRIFWELLGYEINRAERHGYKFCLLVLDLDDFKNINDSFGHAFGDKYLRRVADTIHSALRQGDILGRYGGDEFAVILPEADEEQGLLVAMRIKDRIDLLSLDTPDGAKVKVTVSIGIAVYPTHSSNAKDLFIFADSMMYRAKKQGKNVVFIPTADDVVDIFKKTSEMTFMIIKAIEAKAVIPFFQPIVNLSTNVLEGYEVLSRIKYENRFFHATDFIEIAEKAGMINQLDHNLIDRVFQIMRDSDYKGKVFVNLSTKSLVVSDFIAVIVKLAERYGINRNNVVFEIKERDIAKNISLLEKFVVNLQMQGFKFGIDNFGSVYSVFRYIRNLPIDYVKIEGSFIKAMKSDKKGTVFVQSIAFLCKELGIVSIAKSIEDISLFEMAKDAGVDYGQGFFWGTPVEQLVSQLNDGKIIT